MKIIITEVREQMGKESHMNVTIGVVLQRGENCNRDAGQLSFHGFVNAASR